ncbi:MAG: universal stress protein [Verrucomicrobia bacterium]|nr:universal stress protein [Verrucomicrobiota bacterium]
MPIDFSKNSLRALDVAVSLAGQCGGKINLLHVVQPPAASTWYAVPGGKHYLGLTLHNLADAARKRLTAMASERLPPQLQGQTLVRQGSAYEQIISAARRLDVTLIVISTHGLTGLKRMLIGSTAERVVRHAHCPVLTVPLTEIQEKNYANE